MKKTTWEQLDNLNAMDSIAVPAKVREILDKHPDVDPELLNQLTLAVYEESYDVGYIASHMELCEHMGDGVNVIVTPQLQEAIISLGTQRGLKVKEEEVNGL